MFTFVQVDWAEQQITKNRVKRDYVEQPTEGVTFSIDDPKWNHQWYLVDKRGNSKLPKQDLKVIQAWNLNCTGRGVVISVLDDGAWRRSIFTQIFVTKPWLIRAWSLFSYFTGLEHNNTDIANNYVSILNKNNSTHSIRDREI